MAVQQVVIQMSLRLMMRGSRDRVDVRLGLVLRRGLLLPMVDWNKIFILQRLDVFLCVVLIVHDSVVVGLVEVKLLDDLRHMVLVSEGLSSLALVHGQLLYHGVVDIKLRLLTSLLKGGYRLATRIF